jgi:hypothetical protein
VEDAVAALDADRGRALLDEWRRRGVRVLTTDAVLAELPPGGVGDAPRSDRAPAP